MVMGANFFFFFFLLIIRTVVNTNNCTSLSKGSSWENEARHSGCIMLYNSERHVGWECIYTYITAQIILSFYVKYSGGIWTPTNPLWVNIALFWMCSLMHTASSGKTVYASMCHLGPCVFMCFLCVCACVCTDCVVTPSSHKHCIWVSDSVCYVCVVSLSGLVPTAAPVGHLSSQSYQQGSCNLAANLIIQIAEYLMVLKLRVKKAVLFIYSL